MIVLDASVIFKWIQKDEKNRDTALAFYKNHLLGKNKVLVPKLLIYEMANALATKSELSVPTIKAGLSFIFSAGLIIHRESEAELTESTTLAKKFGTSFYDMLYAVIAKNKKCNLITADEKFVQKTRFKFVSLISEQN
jgi:predicted nucleic acid-binding protein